MAEYWQFGRLRETGCRFCSDGSKGKLMGLECFYHLVVVEVAFPPVGAKAIGLI